MRSPHTVLALVKFGKREHMENLLTHGRVFCQSLSHFRHLESSDAARSDRYEGSSVWLQPAKAVLYFSENPDGEFHDIPGIVGPMSIFGRAELASNTYCMCAIRSSEPQMLIDPQMAEFGDTAVLFTDGNEFLARVARGAEAAGYSVTHRLVDYIDPETYHGETGVFKKQSKFSYQSEFRVALAPGVSTAIELNLGPLTDIAMIGKTSELNACLREMDGMLQVRVSAGA